MVHFRYKWRKSRGGMRSICLPRQARDKRRETALKKRCVFLVGKEHFTDRRVVRPAGTGTGTQATHARARAHTHADGQKQTANSKQTQAHHFDARLRFAFCVLRFACCVLCRRYASTRPIPSRHPRCYRLRLLLQTAARTWRLQCSCHLGGRSTCLAARVKRTQHNIILRRKIGITYSHETCCHLPSTG